MHFGKTLVSLFLASRATLPVAAQSNSTRVVPGAARPGTRRCSGSRAIRGLRLQSRAGRVCNLRAHQAEEVISISLSDTSKRCSSTPEWVLPTFKGTTQLFASGRCREFSRTTTTWRQRAPFVCSMDTEFTRTNARARAGTPRLKSHRIRFAAICPRDSMPRGTSQNRGRFQERLVTAHDQSRACLKFFGAGTHTGRHRAARPGKRLLFTGDTYYPAPIWLFNGNGSRCVRGVSKKLATGATVEAGAWRA